MMVSSWRMSEALTLARERAPDSSTRPRAEAAAAAVAGEGGAGDDDAAAATADFAFDDDTAIIIEAKRGVIASRPS